MILEAAALFTKRVGLDEKAEQPEIIGVRHCVRFQYSLPQYYYIEIPLGKSDIVEPRILPITSKLLKKQIESRNLPGFILTKTIDWRRAVKRYKEPISQLRVIRYSPSKPIVWEYVTRTSSKTVKRLYDIDGIFDMDKPLMHTVISHEFPHKNISDT